MARPLPPCKHLFCGWPPKATTNDLAHKRRRARTSADTITLVRMPDYSRAINDTRRQPRIHTNNNTAQKHRAKQHLPLSLGQPVIGHNVNVYSERRPAEENLRQRKEPAKIARGRAHRRRQTSSSRRHDSVTHFVYQENLLYATKFVEQKLTWSDYGAIRNNLTDSVSKRRKRARLKISEYI